MSNPAMLPPGGLILEGTWDEISRHAESFVGKRLRVTVLELENGSGAMLSEEEEERLLDELAARHAHLPAPPEDAFSRASIYDEHN